jgi:hypothetical protein
MAESRSGAFGVLGFLALILVAAAPATVLYMRTRGPAVAAIAPARARPGEAVTLAGSRFGSTPEANVVLFGGQTGRVLSAKADEVRVEIPELGVAEGSEMRLGVRILAGDRASAPVDLTVYRDRSGGGAETATQPSATGATATTGTAAADAGLFAPTTPATRIAAQPAPRAGAAEVAARPTATRPTAAPPPLPEARPVAEAPKPPPPAPEPAASLRREFVFDRTAAESNKRAAGGLAGFDTSTVDLKRAPDVVGRIDFEVAPPHVKAGDRYTVKAYLINDGPKAIRIKEMFVATTLNGSLSAGPVAPRLRDVGPRQREPIGVFSDVWKDGVGAWAMDVTITSERGDVYKNQVAWK